MTSLSRREEEARLQAMLWQAMNEPIGLLLRSIDPPAARQRLYSARRSAGAPVLDQLQFRLSGAEFILITKGEASA